MHSEFRNWSDVRVFLAVLRSGSTLAASRKLGLAQPTIARRLDALEHETGLILFERDTRGCKPTDAARSLVDLAENIERSAEYFAAKVHELTSRQPIRITSPGPFAEQSMDLFSAFVALNPDITFKFLPSLNTLNLAEGEADVAFRVALSEPEDELICRIIGTARWAIFGSQCYADEFGFPSSINDLCHHRFVTFEREGRENYEHDWLVRNVSQNQIVLSCSEFDLMQASIRAGHGLGLLNVRLAQFDDGLIRCFDDIEELSRPNLMLISPEAYRRRQVKAFVKFFAPRYAQTFT
ncbi:MAG: LysR family transcriptional regulator [Pseudomonadota bacterium]